MLFAGFLLLGGTLERLDQNAMDILNERTINRKNYLETEMVQRWSNMDQAQSSISRQINEFLVQNDMAVDELDPEDPRTVTLLGNLIVPLTTLLRTNSVTGSFLIFQGSRTPERPVDGDSVLQSGIYLRDTDPMTTPDDDSDILVERGPSDVLRGLNYPMDVNWKPAFSMLPGDDFYYEPLLSAHDRIYHNTAANYGYWCNSFTLSGDNVPVISYSQPLLDEFGVPYGVIGVEISADYLHKMMPSGELGSGNSGGYILATVSGESTPVYCAEAVSGAAARRVLVQGNLFHTVDKPIYADIYRVNPGDVAASGRIYASIQSLNLYDSNSPFQPQSWVLVGLIESKNLFAFSVSVAIGVLGLVIVTLGSGILLSFFAGKLLTRPIRVLADTVRNLDPTLPVSLPRTDIGEIDDLSISIEQLSSDVSDASSRLSRIIELSNISLAAFELNPKKNVVYYTGNFFELIDLPELDTPISIASFRTLWDDLSPHVESHDPKSSQTVFKLPCSQNGYRWVRLQTSEQDDAILGVLTDITTEMMEKKRLEYERDYDLLTSLLNRRSFLERITRLEHQPETLKISAMLMLDLDNLKYLNDTYGHDCGDEYIRCAADVLRSFTAFGGIASRISGDEFYLFLSGYESRDKLNEIIEHLQESMAASSILLPNGQIHRLRASMGIAWYPGDSTSLSELIRYADFAMYEAKTAAKGSSRNFNLNTYRRDAFLLYSQEELNHLLDESAVDYAFQPIVSCADGSLLGYEALMRPRSKVLSSPQDVLRIARAQSKLQHIEHLTWFRSMESFSTLTTAPENCMIFINSVSSHALEPVDMEHFVSLYHDYLDRLVVELTESEEQNSDATNQKQLICRRHHIKLALDDFGTGYSNDSVLLTAKPDFVKADMSIIRGIHKDKARQTMLRNLVTLCRQLNIKVIAEGVETRDEMHAVIAIGANYIQGYYTGKPDFCPHPLSEDIVNDIKHSAK